MWRLPTSDELRAAVHIYMTCAYGDARVPNATAARVKSIDENGEPVAYDDDRLFEADRKQSEIARYAIRLGNRHYPHMKLVIERSPDGLTFLLRADTHDSHVRPTAGSKEADAYAQLVRMNQQISESIEHVWDAAGLPTFRSYLRQDLARRRAAK